MCESVNGKVKKAKEGGLEERKEFEAWKQGTRSCVLSCKMCEGSNFKQEEKRSLS